MLAIIETGGKQHRVEVGQTIKVEKLASAPGDAVSFDRVLFYSDDNNAVQVGKPFLPKFAVSGKVVAHGKARKVIVYKQKQRKGYRRKHGHRQPWTSVEITAIGGTPA
jgi:large subunit ribosomal protein L21